MQTRHRIPTIFSIYMVDVLCCALGCVVLLWQVNFFDAEEQTANAVAALENLKNANLKVDSKSNALEAALHREDALSKKLVQVTLELNDTRSERDQKNELALVYKRDFDKAKRDEAALAKLLDNLRLEYKGLEVKETTLAKLLESLRLEYKGLEVKEATLAKLLENLRLDYKGLEQKSTLTASELAEKIRVAAKLAKKLTDVEAAIAKAEKDLERKRLDAIAADTNLKDKNTLLADAEARAKKLESQLAELTMVGKDSQAKLQVSELRWKLLEQDYDKMRKDSADVRKREQEAILAHQILSKRFLVSTKELEDARAVAIALENKNKSLAVLSDKIRQAAENRFAGIALTGNRIVFLVDMSGSMEYVEERTLDPDKWPLVCETLAKIMASIPDLRQYQVILFSDRARYPLGGEGKWLEYQGTSSVKITLDTLKATKPQGETNIHSGFTEAFRYRELGMDTIYFISDGLPTSGEGLPAGAAGLSESQKTEILSRHLRNRLKTTWNRPTAASSSRVRINTIGFFYESPDVGAFLWALARENDGSFVGMSRP